MFMAIKIARIIIHKPSAIGVCANGTANIIANVMIIKKVIL